MRNELKNHEILILSRSETKKNIKGFFTEKKNFEVYLEYLRAKEDFICTPYHKLINFES